MKKVFILLLCAQFITGNGVAMELMKLPLLLQHYNNHEQYEHPGLSFMGFLWEHYATDRHEDGTDEKGHCAENMPFKHCHDCCSHTGTSALVLYTLPVQVPAITGYFSEFNMHFGKDDNFNPAYFCHIWQPPQLG